jgi:hypothetical protein
VTSENVQFRGPLAPGAELTSSGSSSSSFSSSDSSFSDPEENIERPETSAPRISRVRGGDGKKKTIVMREPHKGPTDFDEDVSVDPKQAPLPKASKKVCQKPTAITSE